MVSLQKPTKIPLPKFMFTKPGYLKLSNVLLLTVGGWMIASPFLLGYQDNLVAKNNDIYTGIAIVVLALVNLFVIPVRVSLLSWVIGLLGLWQIGAPFILSYSGSVLALVSAVLAGLITVSTTLWQVLTVAEESEFVLRQGASSRFGPSYASGLTLKRLNKRSS